jgi:hypothetical protein
MRRILIEHLFPYNPIREISFRSRDVNVVDPVGMIESTKVRESTASTNEGLG